MATILSLSHADRAAFAVTSRLISCLITESLLKALFFPINSARAVGACVVLSNRASTAGVPLKKPCIPSDVFVIVPLRNVPVLKPYTNFILCQEIGLVDPLDMLPWIYEFDGDLTLDSALKTMDMSLPCAMCALCPITEAMSLEYSRHLLTQDMHTALSLSLDPLYIWKKFSAVCNLKPATEAAIAQELQSSFLWQKNAYENCPLRPTLASSSIEWERSLVEGHPTHPMHRARLTLPPIPLIIPGQYDYYAPRVRFASIPRASLAIDGDFERLLEPLLSAAAKDAGTPFPDGERSDRLLFPVHELQVVNIASLFPDAEILPAEFSVHTHAQASIRTVTLACAPGLNLKLAVGIKVSSALRTISHFTAYAAPRFGRDVVPRLAIDKQLLVIENEVASAVYRHEDPEVAKHCSALLRETYDGSERGERVIIAAALAETGYGDREDEAPTVVTALGLDTAEAKFAFLERYVTFILDAFLPPMLVNGVAFEAHGQNTLARFDVATGTLTGFVFRDFGGLRIHTPTLLASTGVALDTLPEHCIVVSDINDAYKRLYHTLIHSHLHRLIRVLGFHHDGRGWALVKRSLEARVPRESGLWRAWLDPERTTVMGKCLMRMKLEGLYRDAVYEAVPNLIHYRPQEDWAHGLWKDFTGAT